MKKISTKKNLKTTKWTIIIAYSTDYCVDCIQLIIVQHADLIDPATDQPELTRLVEPDGDDPFVLHPGEFVLGSTLERVEVPDDLSVVGFDGTKFANFVIPSLSTIRRPADQMSQLGAEKLIARITQGRDAARAFETMVSPQFVHRESTGPVPED